MAIKVGTVQSKALPGSVFSPSATPDTFGADKARAIGGLGKQAISTAGQLQAFNEESQNKLKKSQVRSAVNSANKEILAFSAETYANTGQDAIDSVEKTQVFLDKTRQKYGADFVDRDQADLFAASFNSTEMSTLSRMYPFQEKERVAYELNTLAAQNQGAIDNAVLHRMDDSLIAKEEQTIILNTVHEWKNIKGQDKDVVVNAAKLAVDNLHSSVVDAYKAESSTAALEYLIKNESKFTAQSFATQQLKLKADADREAVFIKTIEISKSPEFTTLDEQLDAADKATYIQNDIETAMSAEQKKAVRSDLVSRHNIEVATVEARQKAVFNQEVDKLERMSAQQIAGYKIPLSELTAAQQSSVKLYKEKAIEEKLAEQGVGPGVRDDYILLNEIENLSPAQFQQKDLMQDLPSMTKGTYDKLRAKQTKERKEGVAASLGRKPSAQASAAIKGMSDFNVRSKSRKTLQKTVSTRQQQYYEQFYIALARIPENERTEPAVKEIIDSLLAPVELFGPNIYRFELSYVDDQDRLSEKYLPKSLQEVPGIQYDSDDNVYYSMGAGSVRVYDVNGMLIKTYRKR